MDPVREAERILRRESRRSPGWPAVVCAFGSVIALVVASAVIHTPVPRHGVTRSAVLVSAESTFCAEGVAAADGSTWATSSNAVDHLRLPLRGTVKVIDAADATFSAQRLELKLSPEMPCTAG